MTFIRAREFTGERPWDARDIAEIEGATVRLHWSDQPYIWHANDGDEVFAVLEGQVDMHTREAGREAVRRMETGDIYYARAGDEHLAKPIGPARILVIERKGSI